MILSFVNVSTTGNITYQFTLNNYYLLISNSTYLSILGNTLVLSAITIALCLLLGYPIAYYLAVLVKSARAKTLVLLLMLALFFVDYSTRIIGWYPILGTQGLINSTLLSFGLVKEPLSLLFNVYAIIAIWIQSFILFAAFPIYLSLLKLDPAMLEAAESLGASRSRAFYHITFKMSLPGLVIGALFVFVMSVTDYATPVLIGRGTQTVGLLINYFQSFLYWGLASALSVITMTIILVVILIALRVIDIRKMLF